MELMSCHQNSFPGGDGIKFSSVAVSGSPIPRRVLTVNMFPVKFPDLFSFPFKIFFIFFTFCIFIKDFEPSGGSVMNTLSPESVLHHREDLNTTIGPLFAGKDG